MGAADMNDIFSMFFGGGGGMGERALPPPAAAVAWPQIVLIMVIVPQHTHTDIYILSCARLSCVMCCRCRCWSVGVGRVYMGLLLPTHPV